MKKHIKQYKQNNYKDCHTKIIQPDIEKTLILFIKILI